MILNPYKYAALEGFGNNSREFDGINDYIEIGDEDIFSFGDGVNDSPFSVAAWAKISDMNTFRFLTKYQDDEPSREWTFTTVSSGHLWLFIYDNQLIKNAYRASTVNVSAYLNTWAHYACTYDGSGGNNAANGIKLYINGAEITSTSNGNGYVVMGGGGNTAILRIGTNYPEQGAPNLSEGNLADVRLYDAEIAASDIADLSNGINYQTNLIGHWIGNNDIVGGVVPDLSVNTNDGTNFGTTFSTDGPFP